MRANRAVCGLVLALGAGAAPAHAAVRLCMPMISSEIAKGADELATKKQALDDWKAKAAQLGENFAGWQIATEKLITCLPAKPDGFECVARAMPCVIEQAPQGNWQRLPKDPP